MEERTTQILKYWVSFVCNKKAAKEGGEVAGNARKELEAKSEEKISTSKNYLIEPEIRKKLK